MPLFPRPLPAQAALKAGATAWFVAATLGQWAFVAFIALFFGGHTLAGDLAGLGAKPQVMGYVPGDTLGNAQFVAHALLGGLVTFVGTWQLIPALRRRWPRLHRWNGRLFFVVALVVTLGGFWLTWGRGAQLGLGSNISISLNGLLILAFVGLAWRAARRRDFTTHRQHALRAWLLVNGVWFLRIGIILAGLALAQMGIRIDYTGATFVIVSFASWVLPLAVLELYLWAERTPRRGPKLAVAGLLGGLALITLVGSAAALTFMWWPYL